MDYLSEHTDYKILTNDEYQLLMTPLDQSTPAAEGGVRPKVCKSSTVKLERQVHNRPSHSNTCSGFVFDSSTVLPRFPVFSEEEKNEKAFDVWKNGVQCAFRDGACATHIILQAIRSSLNGKAWSLLLTLPTDAQLFSRYNSNWMESMVNLHVYPSEKLIQQLYASKQEKGESVVGFGMKLEGILQPCIERKAISNDVKNEMLRAKLWSGLCDNSLCNASRYKYDTINDFETLRKELRTIVLDMKLSAP
ncbi:uncharacterized protein LOC133193136 [Saccostrea echinata]|uniref:uncharacterized protein LOC133193136 n=1 Tax=Saccostrea echinata TaxID=191078 RepID=UPI002A8213F1|nr:uncharacterized protein LOC133193136 [Saccostrea echinata]